MAARNNTVSFMSYFGSSMNDFVTRVKSTRPSPHVAVEVEARFRLFTEERGRTISVPPSVFYRMQEYLRINNMVGMTSTTRDELFRDMRRTVDEGTGEERYIIKRRVAFVDSDVLGIRLALSTEEPLRDTRRFMRPEHTRWKQRTSYRIRDTAQLDMTRVSDGKSVTYEVELECLNLDALETTYLQIVSIVWKWVYGSHTIYTQPDLAQFVVSGLNLDPTAKSHFNRDVLVQARNIKRKDLVYGGIVGNPETHYEVTVKADGVRKLLVVTTTGVWAVMPPYEYNRVMEYDEILQPLVGTWLDGEMIPKERRRSDTASPPTTPYWFLAFDVLRVEGRSVQHEPLHTRLLFAKEAARVFAAHPVLRIHAKEFYPLPSVEQFFRTMTELKGIEETLAYKTDGYMFTPALTPYNPRSHEQPMEDRLLIALPDIVKWKPPEELTIDFAVFPRGASLELYCSKKGERGGVRFQGTPENPFDATTMIQTSAPMLQSIAPDTVVEFGWNYTEKVLEPRRIRFDKAVGNNIAIAEDVWNDIHDPIPFTALSSENNDTSHLRAALEWEVENLPQEMVVRPRGAFSDLSFPTKRVVETWDGRTPAVFLATAPTRLPTTEYFLYTVLQDIRINKETPPGYIYDTWTVSEKMLGLYERDASAHFRFTTCCNTEAPFLAWPSPVFTERVVTGRDRLIYFPSFRMHVEAEFDNETYIAFLPSTWDVITDEPTPPPRTPRTPRTPTAASFTPRTPTALPEAAPPPPPVWEESSIPKGVWSDTFLYIAPLGAVEDLACTWYTEYPVVRLGTVGDGSCLFHAVMQGYNPAYQNTRAGRAAYVRGVRKALASFITLRDPENPTKTFFESMGGGVLAAVTTLKHIQDLLTSTAYLGDETYGLIGLCLGVNIYVVRSTGTNVFKHISYVHPTRRQWCVVINGTANHYETVGLRTPEGIQTAFLPEDPFIVGWASAPGVGQ